MSVFGLLTGFAAPSQAVTIISPHPEFQQWADTAKAPTPWGRVRVVNQHCGFIEAYACAKGRTIHTPLTDDPITDRTVFFHELGHVFDTQVMRDPWRAVFMREAGTTSWRPESTELFAEFYRRCADTGGCRLLTAAFNSWPVKALRKTKRQRAGRSRTGVKNERS